MSHPRVEEVEDSDVDMSDPSEGDIDDFAESDIMRRVTPAAPAAQPSSSSSSSSRPTASVPPASARNALLNPAAVPSGPGGAGGDLNNPAVYAGYQCLYPVYFDATRSRAEGRRVPASLAVRNPLAGDIANACARLRLQTVLEPTKLHPKDWANPGRVKVHLKEGKEGGGGATTNKNIKNKHHLYLLIAQHLRDNPAKDHCQSLRLHVPGLPMPDASKPYPRPAVPRGWKMGELLPYYSPAMTGGGVSENLFKDMMKEMGGAGGPGGPGGDMASLLAAAASAGGGGGGGGGAVEEKKKKDKKGKGKS